ncbi:PQQ-binding-like beta-propeller repeat protein [Streptomyces sp. AV19]|uniref:outer membrane protein assembly factor BamB family protein n=1 Tax=Streptomyces sp. AV19 TaxID=2793068 RepID=UPI0018FE2AF0|nr:PQQ-binding-like beta-propeller repeat protein [Streptomyces sp. AV19]MBH1937480.1 PQQ-binding-like beta-propeller repeat protein [Streptomyces sp. AV19]MDG4533747.1 PQQ-like beta-propeller repeat protein [Streptomyces sp. AV19]
MAPDGSWVAACGDLGLALWDDSGTEKWVHEWWADRRTPLRLLAVDDATLVAFARGTITGLSAANGSTLWSVTVTNSGVFGGGTVSGDRRTVVIPSNADGGRLFVIRGGVLANTLPTPADEVSVSDDGSFIAVTSRSQLRAFDADGGLLWTYTGDDLLRRPRVSPDGTRVAVGSELGTLVVLDRDGTVLAAPDLRALPVPAWLPGGDLLAATWMGTVIRYDTGLRPRWQSRLTPAETDIRPPAAGP